MNIQIETARFILRDLEESDAQGIFDLDSDPEVHKFLGEKPIQKIEQAQQIIASVKNQYIRNGIGRWAIIDKLSQEFVGWTGLKYEDGVRDFNYYDLGYRLRTKYWGKGIATETAIASLKYGFETLNLEEIGAAAKLDHEASNKILRKIGMTLIETFDFEGVTHNWYNISKVEWLKKYDGKH